MSAGELETRARLKIPAVMIHFNNQCFGWIKALQALHAEEKFYSVDSGPTDPAKVAEGFGVNAIKIQTSTELDAGLDMACSLKEPVFRDFGRDQGARKILPEAP